MLKDHLLHASAWPLHHVGLMRLARLRGLTCALHAAASSSAASRTAAALGRSRPCSGGHTTDACALQASG
eukprot:778314-Prymnesium_polylepis.1